MATDVFPAWAIENYLETENGHLTINGVDALELVEKFDSPLFVFSEPRIRHNIERLKKAADSINHPVKFCYASKANSNMAVLQAVRDAGIDIEVNSGGELFKVLRVGFRPEQIIFNGTSKTEEEIDDAINAGIYSINADSIYELELIEERARALQTQANVCLRLVPEIETRTHKGLQTALYTSKFGISSSDVLNAFERGLQSSDWLNICGIHIHVGSQTPDIEPYAESFKTMFEHLVKIYKETSHTLEHINIGGGIPVNYLRDSSQTAALPEHEREMLGADLEPAEILQSAMQVARNAAQEADAEHLLDKLTILLEPGRSVIADAGIVLTTVRNIKRRQETDDVWLLTDAGYNIMLSMNNYKWYYHLINASRADESHETDYKVAGPLCDGGDVYFDIEGQGRLPDYRKLSADTNNILFKTVMARSDETYDLICSRGTYEDLIANDMWKE
jgi:D-ornithine/D-lysine decarboxylase